MTLATQRLVLAGEGTPALAPNARRERQPLSALTSLRFFAAFAVLVLHYRDLIGPVPEWVMRGIIGGQYGVTFFFVLSGFILVYQYRDWFAQGVDASRYWAFQRLRLARLYPMYVVGLLLDTPWHLIERAQAGQLAEVGTTYWASWLLNLVGLQAWVPAVPFAMFWNTPAWSVSAEFFFYASFPFVCSWLSKNCRSATGAAWAWVGAVVMGVVLYAVVIHGMNHLTRVGSQTQYIVQFYNPVLRFSEFFAGCVAGHFFLRSHAAQAARPGVAAGSNFKRNAAVTVSLLLVALRIWMPDYRGPSQWLWLLDVSVKHAVFIAPFAALIVAVASGRTFLSGLLERPWLVLLGHASYSLYIIHWSVYTCYRLGYLGVPTLPMVSLALMALTVVASVLCYRWIELPWRSRLRGGS